MTTRILFLCAAHHHSVEYVGRKRLAELLDPQSFDCFFVWQDHTHDRTLNRPAKLAQPDRNCFYDFGRNMALDPKPSKARRALMMASRLPGATMFLAAQMQRIQPHVIYTAQQSYDVVLGRLLSAVYQVPHFIHIHYPVGPWLGRLSYQIIRRTPVLFAVSEFIRQTAIESGIPAERVRTLLNSAEIQQFDAPQDPRALRHEFNLPEDTPVVLCAGRLDPSKGHLMLFEAFAKVQQHLPDARLIVCGQTTTRDGFDQVLRQRVVDLKLQDRIIFAGVRKDLLTLYAGADVFCLPTRNEAFGNVFVESMLARLPVVAIRSGAIPEIVEDGRTGLLSAGDDATGLAEHLLTLLRDRDLARRMGHAGEARARALFTPEKIATTWSALLTEAVASARGSRSHSVARAAGRE